MIDLRKQITVYTLREVGSEVLGSDTDENLNLVIRELNRLAENMSERELERLVDGNTSHYRSSCEYYHENACLNTLDNLEDEYELVKLTLDQDIYENDEITEEDIIAIEFLEIRELIDF